MIHQAAKQSHVRSLRVVRRRQRTVAVEFHQDVAEIAIHQIARQAADPQGGGAVGARWSAHYGTDHIIENTDDHLFVVSGICFSGEGPFGSSSWVSVEGKREVAE
jgi:hypothetical protein